MVEMNVNRREDRGVILVLQLREFVRQQARVMIVGQSDRPKDFSVRSGRNLIEEAPRLIGDFSWTYQKLPFHVQVKGEFEYVGGKVLGNGCNENNPDDLDSYCLGVPNKEFRFALARPFANGKMNLGVNVMIARGYTGRTTEAFATDYRPAYVGSLPVPENLISEVVGVRIPSYASINFTYRLGR